jgi:hypothetical protein
MQVVNEAKDHFRKDDDANFAWTPQAQPPLAPAHGFGSVNLLTTTIR